MTKVPMNRLTDEQRHAAYRQQAEAAARKFVRLNALSRDAKWDQEDERRYQRERAR
jgi:hypothetical protein